MPDSVYRWLLLHPLCRGGLLSLAVAGFCVGCLFLPSVVSPTSCAPMLAAAGEPVPLVDNRPAWPRTVLRLWFLAPQFLPHDS